MELAELQARDAVAWLDLPIAHNEWLDKLKIGPSVESSVPRARCEDIRSSPRRSSHAVEVNTVEFSQSRPARREPVATDRYRPCGVRRWPPIYFCDPHSPGSVAQTKNTNGLRPPHNHDVGEARQHPRSADR